MGLTRRVGNYLPGTGAFAEPVISPLPEAVEWIAIGDIDGDLDLDVATTGQSRPVWISRNNGDGSFGPPEEYEPGETGDLIERLMGSKPVHRFEYIQENARFVEDVDV